MQGINQRTCCSFLHSIKRLSLAWSSELGFDCVVKGATYLNACRLTRKQYKHIWEANTHNRGSCQVSLPGHNWVLTALEILSPRGEQTSSLKKSLQQRPMLDLCSALFWVVQALVSMLLYRTHPMLTTLTLVGGLMLLERVVTKSRH